MSQLFIDPHEQAEHQQPVPRLPLLAIISWVLVTLLAVIAMRLSGVAPAGRYEPTAVVQQRALRFDDRPQGGVVVRDANTQALITTLEAGQDGFVRATLRSLVRERRQAQSSASAEVPFVLSAHEDGRLILSDPVTQRQVALEAFGATNAAAFARFFESNVPALTRSTLN